MQESTGRRSVRAARILAVAGSLAIALTVGQTDAGKADASPTRGQPMIGNEAPAFELKTVSGETVSLAGLRGNYLVIHFGTSW